MMYFNLAYRNLKRNFSNYFTYFISVVSSIVLFYSIQFIRYNDTVVELIETKERMDTVFKLSGNMIMIFVALFILYANIFFIRRRKKEMGMYSMLGMHKSKLGIMLFCENIILGVFALIAGIILGILLSKGFLMFLMNLLGYYKVTISFSVPFKALIITVGYFMLLILFSALANYIIIYRYKLIDLFKGESIREKPIKNFKIVSMILGAFSIGVLCYGYYLAVKLGSDKAHIQNEQKVIIISFICVIIGTFGIYFSVIESIFNLLKKIKAYYFKGLNLFVNRQITHRIHTNAKMLGIITMLIGTTLVVFGSTFSFYYSNKNKIDIIYPFSYEFNLKSDTQFYGIDEADLKYVNEVFEKYKDKNPILYDYIVNYPLIKEEDCKVGEYKDVAESFNIIDETTYNKLAAHGNEHGEFRKISKLKKDTDVLFIYKFIEEESYIGKRVKINNEDFNITSVSTMAINGYYQKPTFVFKDDVFERVKKYASSIETKRYVIVKNAKSAKEITDEIYNLGKKQYYTAYRMMMDEKATLLFVGLFVGLVFLFASGSILSLKQLSDSTSDRTRYDILRKIGVNEIKIKKIIAKQVGITFFMPVILAAIHSYFALGYVSNALKADITIPVIVSTIVFSAIYLIYYIGSVRAYYRLTK